MENLPIRVKMDFSVPEDVLKIKEIYNKNGHELYVVGGAVRDVLLNKTPKDYDLATDASPEETTNMLKDIYKVLPVGEAFGIMKVLTPTGEFEIARYREDVSYNINDLNSFLNFLKKENPIKYHLFYNKMK